MNPRRILLTFVLIIFITFGIFMVTSSPTVDLILYNGIIYTMAQSPEIASAIAITGNRIIDVGEDEYILNKYTAKELIDLTQRTVLPGLIDSHAHLVGLGNSLQVLDLVGIRNPSEIARLVEEKISKNSSEYWIRGRGWDQNLWPGQQFPTARMLDSVSPENPVYLVRIDGHAAWVNSYALNLAGITSDTQDPPGGRIIRDNEGNPTGVLIDNAMNLVARHIPPHKKEEMKSLISLAIEECLSYGITTVHDMGAGRNTIDIYKEMIQEDNFPLRIYVAIDGPGTTWEHFLSTGKITGYGRNKLTVRAIKLYSDGALGSRGAALLEPYSDDPGNMGLLITSEDEIYEITKTALEHGFQVCTHAIGDRGNRVVLNAYERALRNSEVSDHRLRIEHVQVVHPDDFPRFTQLNVIPSIQPIHCTSDMYWAVARLGPERVRGAYAWRTLLDKGSVIVGGSDFPVEPVNPLLGIFAAETRQDKNFYPEGGWYPEERVTRQEAFKMFTRWAAYSGFAEGIIGTLEPGKLADLVVYPVDVMKVEPKELLTVKPDKTILGGKVVFDRNDEKNRIEIGAQ